MNQPTSQGRYDDLCEAISRATQAAGVLLIVINGNRGTGFSATLAIDLLSPPQIAAILNDVANQIESQPLPPVKQRSPAPASPQEQPQPPDTNAPPEPGQTGDGRRV